MIELFKGLFGSRKIALAALISSEIYKAIEQNAEKIEHFVLPVIQKVLPGAEEHELIDAIEANINAYQKNAALLTKKQKSDL